MLGVELKGMNALRDFLSKGVGRARIKVVTLFGANRWNINLTFPSKTNPRLVRGWPICARAAAAFTSVRTPGANALSKLGSRSRIEVHKGVTRTVVLCGAFAFKFPSCRSWKMFLNGLLANMQEREWAGHDNRLCPIIWASCWGWLVVMRRAEPLTDRTWYAMRLQAWNGLPLDWKKANFGRLDGRVVLVDYGN